jgi:parallel beta-helix repeat protein
MFLLAFKIQLARAPAVITVPTDYPTIQAAIYMAYPGDTIRVLNGTYTETLVVNNRVEIIGENKNTTIIDGNQTGTVILITTGQVSISGFTIRNSAPGWPYSGIVINANGANISNNIIENNDHGILLNQTQNCYIANNLFVNNWAALELYYSSMNTITNNNATNNEFGFWTFRSTDNTLSNNNATNNGYGLWLSDSANNNLLNNHMAVNQYNFGVWGSDITHFINNVDVSNLVNGKPAYYWINRQGEEIPPDAGYIALVNSTQMTVRNATLTNNGQGIFFAYTKNSLITENNLASNRVGIELYSSSNNTITNNNATNGLYGIVNSDSPNNLLLTNKAANNQYGIKFSNSSNNLIHSNIFTNNTVPVISSESTNVWDNGYPSGGNYWSNYTGVDLKSGPNQNQLGSDGIGDTPYIIDTNNQDRYPSMNPVTVHEVAVNFTTSKTIVGQGYNLYINVKATNLGDRLETVNITVFANTNLIITQVVNLTLGVNPFTFTWTTAGFTKSNYTISAYASPVLNETNTTDNSFVYNGVIVTVPGDVNGDGHISICDIVTLASCYGSKRGELLFNSDADIDSDNRISIYDLTIAASRYGYKEP